MLYRSTKTYDHSTGLSCCFRQWRADSHCRLLHGYALSFKFIFEAHTLDDRNWVVDFGGLAELKNCLKEMFDHTLVVAKDDPELDYLCSLQGMGLADVRVVERVGCEAFAELGAKMAKGILEQRGEGRRVRVVTCEVCEHNGNSAIYEFERGDY